MVFQELVRELDQSNYHEFLKRDFSVLNFFSDWHMNCLMVFPILDSLAEEFADKIFFGKVDVEENEDLAEKYNVGSVPCLLIFRNGQPVKQFVGVQTKDTLVTALTELV